MPRTTTLGAVPRGGGGGPDVGALPPGSTVAEASMDGSSAVLPGQLGDGREAAEGRGGLGRDQAGGGAGERAGVAGDRVRVRRP